MYSTLVPTRLKYSLGYVTRASHAFDAGKILAGYSLVINVLDLAARPRLAGDHEEYDRLST